MAVIEIGGRGERTFGDDSAFAWDVSLYHARIDDEILSVEDPDAPGTSLATNVDATIHAVVDFVGRRWADFANTYRIDAYSTFGLRAGWTRDRWQVYAELRNLGEEEYVASHSVRNRAAAGERMLHPGEPRSAYIGATVRFD